MNLEGSTSTLRGVPQPLPRKKAAPRGQVVRQLSGVREWDPSPRPPHSFNRVNPQIPVARTAPTKQSTHRHAITASGSLQRKPILPKFSLRSNQTEGEHEKGRGKERTKKKKKRNTPRNGCLNSVPYRDGFLSLSSHP